MVVVHGVGRRRLSRLFSVCPAWVRAGRARGGGLDTRAGARPARGLGSSGATDGGEGHDEPRKAAARRPCSGVPGGGGRSSRRTPPAAAAGVGAVMARPPQQRRQRRRRRGWWPPWSAHPQGRASRLARRRRGAQGGRVGRLAGRAVGARVGSRAARRAARTPAQALVFLFRGRGHRRAPSDGAGCPPAACARRGRGAVPLGGAPADGGQWRPPPWRLQLRSAPRCPNRSYKNLHDPS